MNSLNSSIQTVNQSENPHQSHKDYLLNLLLDLDGVAQNSHYHPEVDALYHSLQVFQCAKRQGYDRILLAAALFHDVGKSVNMQNHAEIGADMLRDVLVEPIPWLVEHHLDLLIQAKRTRKKYRNSQLLSYLEQLRQCDLQGRETDIDVIQASFAIEHLCLSDEIFQPLP